MIQFRVHAASRTTIWQQLKNSIQVQRKTVPRKHQTPHITEAQYHFCVHGEPRCYSEDCPLCQSRIYEDLCVCRQTTVLLGCCWHGFGISIFRNREGVIKGVFFSHGRSYFKQASQWKRLTRAYAPPIGAQQICISLNVQTRDFWRIILQAFHNQTRTVNRTTFGYGGGAHIQFV